jgi:ABC-type amino acid transport system permease subunit
MDYEIFLLTRIRERFLQTNNTRDAVAYGVSTSARTITSAALIMIAVFIGFAFDGMPLVAEIGVASAAAIAVDATVVRLVLVPALLAMFDQWNWWLPAWLARILPSVDFEKPLPMVDLGDVVMIPEDISAPVLRSADLRVVLKSAAKLKRLVPDAISVTDPLALTGCGRRRGLPARVNGNGAATHRSALAGAITTALSMPPYFLLADKTWAFSAVLIVIVWKYFGFHMMLYIAGLQAIDRSLLEAAEMDGASAWQRFRYITLPLLGPMIRLSIFFSVVGALQLFDIIVPLTGGGPFETTNTMVSFLYYFGITRMRVGFGSAVGVVLFVICVTFAFGYRRIFMRND